MRRYLSLALVLLIALLAACASPTIRSDVTVFQEWPADLQGATYVFERTKEQDNSLEYRNYENLVRGELNRLGFVEAGPSQTPKLKVTLDYHIAGRDVHVVEPVIIDPYPYGSPFYGPFYRNRWHRGYYRPYGPFYDPFWYGPPTVGYQESNYQAFNRQLEIVISRIADGKKLYDVTVNSDGRNGSLASVMPYMVSSAFTDFPAKNGETRQIDLSMKK